MTYDPKTYWQERANHYDHTERLDELQYLLMALSLIEKPNILDMGSGDGRVFNYLSKVLPLDKSNYTMCDIVDNFRNQCSANTGIMPDLWDGKTLPYSDNQFNFVMSISVMLHVPANEIDSHIKECIRVSGNLMFVATWCEKNMDYMANDYCIHHDYYKLFKENNLEIIYDRDCYFNEGKFRRKNFLLKKNNLITK